MPDAEPAPATTSMTAEELLDRVNLWMWKLAHKHARRCRVAPEDFAHELRVDVFLHRHLWQPERGSLTGWVEWRARSVRTRLLKRPRRAIAAVSMSTFDYDDGPGEFPGIDPDAGGGRVEREEEQAEVVAAVRAAVAELSPENGRCVSVYYGIGREKPAKSREDGAAATGKTLGAFNGCVTWGRVRLSQRRELQELARRVGIRSPAAG